MPDDIEAFQAYLVHPDTNRAVLAMLLDECMADSDTIIVMKALNQIMSED